jgi:hypothetical protein
LLEGCGFTKIADSKITPHTADTTWSSMIGENERPSRHYQSQRSRIFN